MIVEGMIQDTEIREVSGATGPFKVIGVVINGIKVSGYADKYGYLADSEGDESKWFRVEYKKNAKGYFQIETVEPMKPETKPAAIAPVVLPTDHPLARPTTNRDTSIECQTIIKAAAEMTAGALHNGALQPQSSGAFFQTKCEEAWEWLRSKTG